MWRFINNTKSSYSFAITMVLLTTGAASATPTDSVGLQIDGTHNAIEIESAPGNSLYLTVIGDPLLTPSTGLGKIFQSGSENSLVMQVLGSENFFALSQQGNGNSITGFTSGSFNELSVVQSGQGNHASFSQQGRGNKLSIVQGSW